MQEATEITELIADVRERVLYLHELGLDTFDVKFPQRRVDSREALKTAEIPKNVGETKLKSEPPRAAEQRRSGSRLAELPSLSKRNMPGSAVSRGIASSLPAPIETIEQIRDEIGLACMRCKLCSLGRSKVVNSTGNLNAELMFVGEAPGADEDEQGMPFVGRAGKLLTDIINAMGFNREDVFIGNINRCRPPGNRQPETDESVVCKPFLLREIAVIRPKVIVVLGAHAAQNLLETKVPIGKLRGHFHNYLGTKVMPTFHPAYLLRDPHKKREVWEDMKIVRDYLAKNPKK